MSKYCLKNVKHLKFYSYIIISKTIIQLPLTLALSLEIKKAIVKEYYVKDTNSLQFTVEEGSVAADTVELGEGLEE